MADKPSSKKPSVSSSVFDEPHMKGSDRATVRSVEESLDNNVWEEPSILAQGASVVPDGALNYGVWLKEKIKNRANRQRREGVFALVVLVAGPLAILGTFLSQSINFISVTGGVFVAVAIVGPLTEEVMKVAVISFIIEKKPYLFVSRRQILVCGLASGFAFAAVENLLYLNVYVPDPPDALVLWRWTICVFIHMLFTFVACTGLAKVWSTCVSEGQRPRMGAASKRIFLAVLLHGVYNGTLVLLDMFGIQFI